MCLTLQLFYTVHCILFYCVYFYMFSRYKGKLLYFAYFYARNIQYVRLTKNVFKNLYLIISAYFLTFSQCAKCGILDIQS